tara:strand:- start:5080 stop:5763 length:684 start_codon:yes stop_codon:yes gene_type:complete
MVEALIQKYVPEFNIKDQAIFKNAFIHKSAVRDTGCSSNERLEFIGDSVLNLIIAKYLYEKYPNENEGFLTRVRTQIVSGASLSKISAKLGLQSFIVMNAKAMNNEWNTNPRILEDAMESLIGAIFLDSDLKTATKFVVNIVNENMNDDSLVQDTNYKDMLMKLMQSKSQSSPVYFLRTENGPDHNKIFTIQITVDGKVLGEGYEKNKKKAEQSAARRVLRSFSLID